ncbi:hypothetical protein Ndes2526B_g04426 [Nannochloris sp. 'desiccata']
MATTVPSSSFAICLTDPIGEEATSPNRETQTLDGSVSLRHKRKHAALQDTAESPPAAVIEPLVGLDRPTRQANNAAPEPNLEVLPIRVSKRLSMKVDEPIHVPVKKVPQHLSKTARLTAAKQAGAPPRNTAAPAVPSVNEDVVLKDAERPRRAQKLPKRLEESILLLEKKMMTATTTVAHGPATTAPKLVQRAAALLAVPKINSSEIKLGCSKCRFTPKGCRRCREKAAAAGANVEKPIEAADRANCPRKSEGTVSAQLPAQSMKKQQLETKKVTVQQKEDGAAVRRVSARRLGLDPIEDIEPKEVSLNREPSSTEKKRGRKPVNTAVTAAAAPAKEQEPGPMEIEQPEIVAAPVAAKETHHEKGKKKILSPLKGKAAASPPKASSSRQEKAQQQQQGAGEKDQAEEQKKDASWWNPLDPFKVSQAQAALHVSSASIPGQELPLCRERQINNIDDWLADRLQTAQGGSLYISGLPGTGKSLTALELVRRCGRHLSQTAATSSSLQQKGGSILPPALIAVNCMRFSEPKQAVERILAGYHTACRQVEGKEIDPLVQVPDEGAAEVVAHRRRGSSLGGSSLVGGGTGKTPMTPQELLRRIVLQPMPTVTHSVASRGSRRKGGRESSVCGAATGAVAHNDTSTAALVGDGRGMIVAVLDELDGLLTGPRGDVLVGELFALAHAPRSRLILIGIANSIDLVQQLMRPGGSLHRHNLRPAHEIFPAYLSSQVADVITQRLSRLPGPVFDPKTIQFCARKIANGSGDMRRALEACARAISVVATDEQKKAAASPAVGATDQNTAQNNAATTTSQPASAVMQNFLVKKMGSRGLAVKVPTAPGLGGASAAARFIGTAAIAQPLLEVTGGPGPTANVLISNGPSPGTAKKPKVARNSFADAHRRRSSNIIASSKELTVGDLRAAHAGLCKRVGVTAYSQVEFNVAIDMLGTQGLVELKGGAGKGPLQRVGLQIAEDDVLMALADVPVLKDVVGA